MRGTQRLAIMMAVMTPLSASTVAAQGSFEGVVTYQVMKNGNTSQPEGTMVYSVKGTSARMDMNMGTGNSGQPMNAVGIFDGASGKMMMLMPQMKMYMDLSADVSKNQEHTDSLLSAANFQKTGSETVAGVSCDDYQGKDQQGKLTFACLAHGMGNWVMFTGKSGMGHGGSSMGNSQMASLFKQGFFPLKMGNIENGKQVPIMVATSVQRKTVDASLFQVPSDYQNMSNMNPAAIGAMMKAQQGQSGQKSGQP